MVQNAYTELRKGSKIVIVVVRNSMAYPQTLKKKTLVARAVEWPFDAQVNHERKARHVV